MRKDDHSGSDLLLQLVEFLITFLDLFVQSLVFDLQLLEVDQVQAIRQLLLLLVHLLKVIIAIPQRNVLQAVLVHLLVFDLLMLLPVIDHFIR